MLICGREDIATVLVYKNALKFYLKAQKVNDKDSGLNELIIQIQDFLDKQ
ncbi:MAG TPA: hypothetical protein VKY33_06195 [Flavobacterium sp.]|nr:hypothetical protein [Flavobacterium sp.]